jgi:lysophospholipase L1-like esterase
MTPRTRRRVVFALIPTIVLLLVLETAARLYERSDRDARERAEQTAEPNLKRRDGETLVYVYGESTVYGLPVPEVGLVRQLQHYASRRYPGRDVRFVNLGRKGIDSEGLLDLVEATIGMHPDLAIVLCGHNEFLHTAPRKRVVGGLVSWSATVRVASRLVVRTWPGLRTAEILPDHVVGIDRASALFRNGQRHYFDDMTAIVRAARAEGVPVLLGTLPSNLRDWPPVFRRLLRPDGDPTDVSAMEEALAAANRNDASTLRSFVGGPAAKRPDDPMFRFLRGRLRLLEGDTAGAMADLVFARDEDPLPWRVSSVFNDFVRKLASDEQTLFADLDGEMRAGGVPGFELVADNCHPSPEGARLMALALLRATEAAGILPPPGPDPCDLPAFLTAAGFVPGSALQLRYLLENGKYLMRSPDMNFAAARPVFELAVRESPQSWEARANLGTVLLIEGRRAEGTDAVRRATDLHGGPLDVSDRDALPYLYEALHTANSPGR